MVYRLSSQPLPPEVQLEHDRIRTARAAIEADRRDLWRQQDELKEKLGRLNDEESKLQQQCPLHLDGGGFMYGFCTVCGACLG